MRSSSVRRPIRGGPDGDLRILTAVIAALLPHAVGVSFPTTSEHSADDVEQILKNAIAAPTVPGHLWTDIGVEQQKVVTCGLMLHGVPDVAVELASSRPSPRYHRATIRTRVVATLVPCGMIVLGLVLGLAAATCTGSPKNDDPMRGTPISIADLAAKKPRVGAFIIDGYAQFAGHCEPCPKDANCKPCEEVIWVSATETASALPLDRAQHVVLATLDSRSFTKGVPYRFGLIACASSSTDPDAPLRAEMRTYSRGDVAELAKNRKVAAQLAAARALLSAHDNARAIALLTQMQSEFHDGESSSELALAALAANDLATAESAARAALNFTSRGNLRAAAHYNLGLVLVAKGDKPGAIDAFETSLDMRPNATVQKHLVELDPSEAKRYLQLIKARPAFEALAAEVAATKNFDIYEMREIDLAADGQPARVAYLFDRGGFEAILIEKNAKQRWLLTFVGIRGHVSLGFDMDPWSTPLTAPPWRRTPADRQTLSVWQSFRGSESEGGEIAIRGGQLVVVVARTDKKKKKWSNPPYGDLRRDLDMLGQIEVTTP